jgi:uncharacterized protein YeaO (DUF488 family)
MGSSNPLSGFAPICTGMMYLRLTSLSYKLVCAGDGGMIAIKRAYEAASKADGARFLVDRLWPRGVKKEDLAIKAWLKDVAPSNELRRWYHHDLDQWNEFRRRYFAELEENPEAWQPLLEAAREGTLTLVYSAKNEDQNNAEALKEFLTEHLHRRAVHGS